MPFLETHQSHIDIQKSAVVMAGKELVCVEKFGRPLVSEVQVVQDCTVPGWSQATLCCKVNCRKIAELGAVEEMHGKIQLANSLNWLDCRGSFSCNASILSRSRSSYRLVRWWGSTTPSKKQMLGWHWKQWTAPREPSAPRTRREAVSEHVADLYDGTCKSCKSSNQRQELALLLLDYSDIFSS